MFSHAKVGGDTTMILFKSASLIPLHDYYCISQLTLRCVVNLLCHSAGGSTTASMQLCRMIEELQIKVDSRSLKVLHQHVLSKESRRWLCAKGRSWLQIEDDNSRTSRNPCNEYWIRTPFRRQGFETHSKSKQRSQISQVVNFRSPRSFVAVCALGWQRVAC
jgi:hypothetical protein